MKRPGFTLMEILVASAIFAGVMIVTVSAFAIVTRTQTKTLVNRKVGQSARLVNEQISRAVRGAIPGALRMGTTPVIVKNYNGFVGINSSVTPPTSINEQGNPSSPKRADILVVFSKSDEANSSEIYQVENGRVGYTKLGSISLTPTEILHVFPSTYLTPEGVTIDPFPFLIYTSTDPNNLLSQSPYVVLDYVARSTGLQVFSSGELQVKTTAVWRKK